MTRVPFVAPCLFGSIRAYDLIDDCRFQGNLAIDVLVVAAFTNVAGKAGTMCICFLARTANKMQFVELRFCKVSIGG